MKPAVFVDTGAFYARYVAKDEHHAQARSLWEDVRRRGLACLTTNFVLAELITLLVYRFGTPSALQAAREIYVSHGIQIVSVTLEIETRAMEWMEKFSDQKFSMTDVVSFALMEDRNLRIAFTFDRHFEVAGFEKFG